MEDDKKIPVEDKNKSGADLTILPVKPAETEFKKRRPLHYNIPDPYKGQLLVIAAPIRSGKGVLWNNFLLNPNFYAELFQEVHIISPTVFNDATARFAAERWKHTCHAEYRDEIIHNLVKQQNDRKKEALEKGTDSGFCLIGDDLVGVLNNHQTARKGGAFISFATRFRHAVNKGDPCMIIYSGQKYNNTSSILRSNMTGLLLSGNMKSQKEIESIKDDIGDTFGGHAAIDHYIERAREKPFSWLYFRLDSTPPEVYLDFTERLF
mgnify:CR=1 FL=1|jgi:hypothetical protein|tara:strand:+ start:910 stop:1704 length:795 start_codon:yes stop_codon:yes gene_type:complete